MYISYVFYWCTQRGGEVPVEVLEVSQHQPAGETCWGPNIRIPKFRSLQMKNPNQSWPARMFNVHIVVFCVKDVEYFQYSFCMYSTHTCMRICNLYVLREEGYICVVYWNIERNNVPFSVEVSKQESSDELEHRLGGRCSSSRDLSLQLLSSHCQCHLSLPAVWDRVLAAIFPAKCRNLDESARIIKVQCVLFCVQKIQKISKMDGLYNIKHTKWKWVDCIRVKHTNQKTVFFFM